jgi:hypothetical protein
MFNTSKNIFMEKIKMSKAQFVQYLVNEVSGSQFVGVTTRTPLEMRKGRSKANRNPYIGRVEIVKTRSLFFGWLDYEKTINGRLERKGCDGEFKTEPMSGRKWLHYGKVERNKYDENRLYIRFYTKKDNPFTAVYLVDGTPATEEQIAEFTPWIVEKNEDYSAKQASAGLVNGEQVFPRCPMVDNILSIRINHTEIVLED